MPKRILKGLLVRLIAQPRLRDALWTRWYRHINRLMAGQPVWFMNYGLVPPDGAVLPLREADESNRPAIELYHRVTQAIDLRGADLLEVSCGRGGGARYLAEYRQPRLLVGLDRTHSAVAFCVAQHAPPTLRFVSGNAVCLPFADAAFDAVINVEASHCYADLDRFFSEARRVLRPGGHFLYADMRKGDEFPAWRQRLVRSGFRIIEEEDITEHVLRALNQTYEQKERFLREKSPRLFRRLFAQFAGAKGSAVYEGLVSGRIGYARFVLRRDP